MLIFSLVIVGTIENFRQCQDNEVLGRGDSLQADIRMC